VTDRLRGPAGALAAVGLALAATWLLVAPLLAAPGRELPCRVLPNGRVSVLPDLRARCPLEPLDQVHALAWEEDGERRRGGPELLSAAVALASGPITVEVRRDGAPRLAHVFVRRVSRAERAAALGAACALAAALMALPVLLLRRSPAPAAVPFALFCTAIAALVFAAASGLRGSWIYRLEAASLVVLATALAHLALVFPAPRPVLARAPALTRLPWAVGAPTLAVAWLALERDALLWPAVCYLLIALAASAWCVLLAGARSDASASGAAVERVRARLLLCATLFLPILPAWLLAELVPHGRHLAAQVVLASLALVPLSVGVAMSRYDLFELGADARRAAARLLFYTAAAGVGTALTALLHAFAAAGAPPHAPLELFASGLACVALADGVRGAWLRQLEAALAPGEVRARTARDAYARGVPELRDEAEVLRQLGAALGQALAPVHVAAFAAEQDALRPLFAHGDASCVDAGVARAALAALGPHASLLVSRAASPGDAALLALRRRGVELVGALRWRGALLGVVLLGAPSARSSKRSAATPPRRSRTRGSPRSWPGWSARWASAAPRWAWPTTSARSSTGSAGWRGACPRASPIPTRRAAISRRSPRSPMIWPAPYAPSCATHWAHAARPPASFRWPTCWTAPCAMRRAALASAHWSAWRIGRAAAPWTRACATCSRPCSTTPFAPVPAAAPCTSSPRARASACASACATTAPA
jgi:hypothetical protein